MKPFPEQRIDPPEPLEDRLYRIAERENDRALAADLKCSTVPSQEECRDAVKYCDGLFEMMTDIVRTQGRVG
jgi:hypothetical protein